MASRAISRGRKYLFYHLNVPICSCSSISSSGHGSYTCDSDRGVVDGVSNPKHADVDHRWERRTILDSCCGKAETILPFGSRLLSHSVRLASTVTAKLPESASREDHDEYHNQKQTKEASSEECDQAADGLSLAKAKAKAKQLQETSKVGQSYIHKIWAKILGIGPALRVVACMSREDWVMKYRHWKNDFVSTIQHYWFGFKLLWVDIRISSKLLLKLAGGKRLSRRERQQLTRTTADIFRLVPFAVFIIVPFMEFLLPVFLKLFPNMLPSTFQDNKMKEQEALKRRLNARIEYAKFLQDTVKEMAKEVQRTDSGEIKQIADDFNEFVNKVRTGASVVNKEILSFAKLFNDKFTLDNICRPRLVNMCKYMGILPIGTDKHLRFMLRKKLQWIKKNDKLIQAEGVDSLSEEELRQTCCELGPLGWLSTEEMRQQAEEKEKVKEDKAKKDESAISNEDVSLREMTGPTSQEAEKLARARTLEKKEQLCNISCALALLASASSVSRERHEFLSLVNKEIELYNTLLEKEGTEGEEEATIAYRAARKKSDHTAEVAAGDKVSSTLINRVDAMLLKLEKEIDDVDTKIGDHWKLLDRDHDGMVTLEEVASAAMYLKDTLGREGVQELISNLSKDRDGKILVEYIIKLGTRTDENDGDED